MSVRTNNTSAKKTRLEEYRDKFEALRDEFLMDEEEIESRYPGWRGEGHPAYNDLFIRRKKLYADIRALQNEYQDIFPISSDV